MTAVAWSGRPVPRPTELSQPYWAAARRRELLYLQCQQCGTAFFPPLEACVSCQSGDLTWQRSSGRGSVYSYTVLHAAPSEGFPVPTVLAIVDVDEGYPMFSNVIDCPPADVRIGMRVEACFERLTDQIDLPVFRPAKVKEQEEQS